MLSKFSVKRPYIIVVAVIIALILGGVSLSKMKTDLLPDMDIPYLMVMTTDPGASAEKVETEVTEVLESTLSTVNGVTEIQSQSANTFSMAIAGPFLSYGIYRLGRKLKINKSVCVFLATCLGDLFTYCVTSVQLGFAHPAAEGGVMASITTFMGIFAVTQIPLAIVEGLLSVVVILALESYASSELGELAYSQY